MANTDTVLPIIVHRDIESAYINLNRADVVYTNFETSRTLTSTTADTLLTSVCSTTASQNDVTSGTYNVVRQQMVTRGFLDSSTSLTLDIGVFALKKRFFDEKIKEGSFTATITGAHAGDYYDSGSGELKRKVDNITYGVFLNDEGIFAVTSTSSSLTALVQSITAIKYKGVVGNTELSVFCKAQPNEQNYTLNPSSFATASVGNYMVEPFTGSTTSSNYFADLVSSGQNWRPYITHVGLYNDENDLLALAKFAQPLRKPSDVPITVRVQLDI